MAQTPKQSRKKWKPKKLTAAQKKEIHNPPENWTEQVGSNTAYYGGQAPKRRTFPE